jgi:TIR domain
VEKVFPVFCCYARKDYKKLDELKTYLTPLVYEGLIEIQSDVDIQAGKEWEKEIEKYLDTAQIILLLLSPNFMASPYCNNIEMKRAIERHDQGKARVIPILLEPVDLHGKPFSKLQALPTYAKPVVKWSRRGDAFLDIANGIRRVIKESGPKLQGIIPISKDLLAHLNRYKEKCKLEWNTPFLTPHFLLALFELPNSRMQYFLDYLTPPCAAEVQNMLNDSVDDLKGGYDRLERLKGSSFSDLQWEERLGVRLAQQLALEGGSNEVTEEYLLLGVLEKKEPSDTVQKLRKLLGEDNMDELVKVIYSSLGKSPTIFPVRGTDDLCRRSLRER